MHIKKEKLYPFMSYLNFLVERLASGHCYIGSKEWIKKMVNNLRILSVWMCWKRSGGNRLMSLRISLKNRKVKKNNNSPRSQKIYFRKVLKLQIPYQKNQTRILMISYKNNKSKLSLSQKNLRSRRLARNWSLQRKKKEKRKISINICFRLNQKSWTLTIRFVEAVS